MNPLNSARPGRGILICLAGIVLPTVVGCSGESLEPVRGVVRYKGRPLAGASVTFVAVPEGGAKPSLAVARTDADGSYSLLTRAAAGAMVAGGRAGKYRVAISKAVPPKSMTPEEYQRAVDEEARQAERTGVSQPGAVPEMVELLPPECSDLARTALTADVTPGRANTIDFDLP